MRRFKLFAVKVIPATDTEAPYIDIEETHNGPDHEGYSTIMRYDIEDVVQMASDHLKSIGLDVHGRTYLQGYAGGILVENTSVQLYE
jgi:hypothetical protein